MIEVPQAQVIAVDVDVSSFKVYDFLQLGIFIVKVNLNDVIKHEIFFLCLSYKMFILFFYNLQSLRTESVK